MSSRNFRALGGTRATWTTRTQKVVRLDEKMKKQGSADVFHVAGASSPSAEVISRAMTVAAPAVHLRVTYDAATAPSDSHDRPASRARSTGAQTVEVVRYSPPVQLRVNVPLMVTDTGGFEDHVAVSRRQRRNRAPSVATPAPMSRRRDGWEQHQESEAARASLSSLDTVTSVPDFAWPESQTTLSARTEPAGRNAMGDDSPAVPKTSVRKDATGSPLTSRSNVLSHSRGHPDHDADRSRVAVTHLKRDAHVSELRARERGTPRAEHGEEQSHYRRTRTCKISTDAGRGKKH
ncbi:hypothetical protein MRX96_017700 [Rhipicephalus microplus]